MLEMLPQFLVTGVLIGGIYALIGLGIVLVYKATAVFNFAVGQFFVMGAFFCWSFIVWAGLPVWLSILLALAGMVILGFVIERLVLRPLIGQPVLASIMATVGLMALLGGIAMLIWGSAPTTYPTAIFPGATRTWGTVIISNELSWAFLIALVTFGAFAAFFRWTRVGLGMRATAEDQQLARGTGVNVGWIFGLTWAIGAVVSTLAGIVLAARLGLGVNETPLIALRAFPVVILGGLDSVVGVIVAGIIVGLLESVVGGLVNPTVGGITPYFVLLLALVIRPEGLFGLKRIERI